jgi:hypothetical protein
LFRSHAQFAMGFVGVAMESQSVDVWVASTGRAQLSAEWGDVLGLRARARRF